ncbi:hypothetical protein [Xenorhabdus koppenhoeferi]|nr:hypothetical protein [Xenorhabdus sp. Vera]
MNYAVIASRLRSHKQLLLIAIFVVETIPVMETIPAVEKVCH